MRLTTLALLAACRGGTSTTTPTPSSTPADTDSHDTGPTLVTRTADTAASPPTATGTTTASTAHTGTAATSVTADTGFVVGTAYLLADHTITTDIDTYVSDLDGDHRNLVALVHGDEKLMYFFDGQSSGRAEDAAYLTWGNGHGYFYEYGYDPPALQRVRFVGDLTGDGDGDIAFDGAALQTRAGPVEQHPSWDTEAGRYCDGGTSPTGHYPHRCGDLTGDGVAELCVAEGVAVGPVDEIPFCSDEPNSNFEPVVLPLDLILPLEGTQWRRMVGADTDGDGRNELLVYQSGNGDGTAAIHHLVDIPLATTATLEDLAPAALGWNTHTGLKHLFAADLTGDGRDNVVHVQADLVRIGADPGDLLIDPHALLPVDSTGGGAAVGDFDRDGIYDIALGQPELQQALVFLGPFQGTHSGVPDLVLGAENPLDSEMGSLLAAADLDGDGFEDLIVVDDVGGPGFTTETGPRSGSKIFVYYGATMFP